MNSSVHHPASYRDPSGFVFKSNGKYYRQVNQSYSSDYDHLISSGLYHVLTEKEWMIPHEEIDENITGSQDQYKTILPLQLPFISYPYEWCFDQLKDAALLTLRILKRALQHGMILKDATAFNIQFYESRPIFIDTLSFEKYDESRPWIAYRQFCECFLFPLLLEHYFMADIQKMLTIFPEGIPARTTAGMLPFRSKFRVSNWLHVFLQHAVGQRSSGRTQAHSFNRQKLERLIDHLESTVKSLHVKSSVKSTWNTYYEETILSKQYLSEKEKIFRQFIEDITDGQLLDLGANDGFFSLIAAEKNTHVIAVDFDSHCINRLYLQNKERKQKNILPLCNDISNPSPAIGFRNEERQTFIKRAKSNVVIALALIHHLVLSKNIPLSDVALQFAELADKYLIIEFIPLEDEKSQQLISNKTAFHLPYDPLAFETEFNHFFEIERKELIFGTRRLSYDGAQIHKNSRDMPNRKLKRAVA